MLLSDWQAEHMFTVTLSALGREVKQQTAKTQAQVAMLPRSQQQSKNSNIYSWGTRAPSYGRDGNTQSFKVQLSCGGSR